MIKKLIILFFLLSTSLLMAQQELVIPQMPSKINDQSRYHSKSRIFYVWSDGKDAYEPRDAEFENSVIDIREIGSRNNGYIVLSLNDDGKVRLYHGSIISYNLDENGLSTWIMRSKSARGKLVLDPERKTFTYSYESNEKRYLKIFVFNISYDEDNEEQ